MVISQDKSGSEAYTLVRTPQGVPISTVALWRPLSVASPTGAAFTITFHCQSPLAGLLSLAWALPFANVSLHPRAGEDKFRTATMAKEGNQTFGLLIRASSKLNRDGTNY
jgi:hypothetical protein